MKIIISSSLLIFVLNFSDCQKETTITNLNYIPEVTAADQPFANVFGLLDGTWKGEFLIFEDEEPMKSEAIDLKNISEENLRKAELKEVNRLEVQQVYSSESPYFQQVVITDFYPDTGKKVVSKGVNKVQDGKLWCVVKNTETNKTNVHFGSTDGPATIIWQSNEQQPQKIEYFRETVSEKYYEIIGWGYYEGHDQSLSPKLWFYGKYERIK